MDNHNPLNTLQPTASFAGRQLRVTILLFSPHYGCGPNRNEQSLVVVAPWPATNVATGQTACLNISAILAALGSGISLLQGKPCSHLCYTPERRSSRPPGLYGLSEIIFQDRFGLDVHSSIPGDFSRYFRSMATLPWLAFT